MSGSEEALRGEVAALAGTIRELREELASQRLASAAGDCHGCGCHGCGCHPVWIYQPYTPPAFPGITWTSQPYTFTCGGSAHLANI